MKTFPVPTRAQVSARSQAQVDPLSPPLRVATQRLLQHVARELVNEARVLGQRDELVRADGAQCRVRPAGQGLDTGHGAGGRLHLGLVGDPDGPAREGFPQRASRSG